MRFFFCHECLSSSFSHTHTLRYLTWYHFCALFSASFDDRSINYGTSQTYTLLAESWLSHCHFQINHDQLCIDNIIAPNEILGWLLHVCAIVHIIVLNRSNKFNHWSFVKNNQYFRGKSKSLYGRSWKVCHTKCSSSSSSSDVYLSNFSIEIMHAIQK